MNNAFSQLDPIDIYTISYTTGYTFFSYTEEIPRLIHILGHKTNLDKFKIILIQNMFSDHNGFKLEISNRKILAKSPHIWKLNNNTSKT